MRERRRKHDDLHRPMGGKGKRATPPKARLVSVPMLNPLDICHCGDYRRDHKNGVGACAFNEPGRFDLCHGGEDCQKFRLHQEAPRADDLAAIPGDLAPAPKR